MGTAPGAGVGTAPDGQLWSCSPEQTEACVLGAATLELGNEGQTEVVNRALELSLQKISGYCI